MLQSMGSQRAERDLVPGQKQQQIRKASFTHHCIGFLGHFDNSVKTPSSRCNQSNLFLFKSFKMSSL